nr:peroxiredoxin [Segniliparus rugosus]
MPRGGAPALRRVPRLVGGLARRDPRDDRAHRGAVLPPHGPDRPTGRRRASGQRRRPRALALLPRPARGPAGPRGRRSRRAPARSPRAEALARRHVGRGGPAGRAGAAPRGALHLPLTGRPDFDLPEGWNAIPGARGCTPESCGFRDHFHDLLEAGAGRVYGLSSQDSDYQREVVERLHLPFDMLSDPGFSLAEALRLPTFEAGGARLHTRLTLVLREGRVEHVFYPIFPPDRHAEQVLAWLRGNPLEPGRAPAAPPPENNS